MGRTIPLFPKRPHGRFFMGGGERGPMRTLMVRQICLEQIWTAEGWPRSAQRVGERPTDGPNNPALSKTPAWAFFYGWRRERSDENPYGSANLSGTNLDSRRLAPERAARRGEAHGWAEQSRSLSKTPAWAFFYGRRRERSDENPYGSTNLSGTNLDSRRLAPERAARRGEAHGWAEQSLAHLVPHKTPARAFFMAAHSRDRPHPSRSGMRPT